MQIDYEALLALSVIPYADGEGYLHFHLSILNKLIFQIAVYNNHFNLSHVTEK